VATLQTIACKKREIKSKGYLKQMRRNHQVPGVIYGKGTEAMPVMLDEKQLKKTFKTYGYRGLFSLEVDGQEGPVTVLVREVQKHPINERVLHVDFLTVNMEEKIDSSIAVYITGEEEINKKGGILQLGIKEVDVSCLPQDLPNYLTCDVSNLEIGGKITVGGLKAPENVKITSDPETVIALVLAPSKAAEAGGKEEVAEAAEVGGEADDE